MDTLHPMPAKTKDVNDGAEARENGRRSASAEVKPSNKLKNLVDSRLNRAAWVIMLTARHTHTHTQKNMVDDDEGEDTTNFFAVLKINPTGIKIMN